MKEKIYQVLSPSNTRGNLSWAVDVMIIGLIVLNCIAIILESFQPLKDNFGRYFELFELFSVVVFSVEYVLRVWVADLDPAYRRPIIGNIKYASSPFAIIDLVAIIPFYLPLVGVDLRVLRFFRVLRLFRILKLARYVQALSFMKQVFISRREELLLSVFFIFFLLIIASTLMYFVENPVQPENFSSIPETMWWGIATLTTVGYGDMYPVTGLGQLLGGVIAILGIGLLALPTGIIASGFSDAVSQSRSADEQGEICPTCGHKLSA